MFNKNLRFREHFLYPPVRIIAIRLFAVSNLTYIKVKSLLKEELLGK